MDKLISIITVNFNNRKGLKSTIESIVSQEFKDFEFIIIDGGSVDGSVDVIKMYEPRMSYWISEIDKGIYDAMNKGISKAIGKYLLFLNSGDIFLAADTLEKCHNLMKLFPSNDIYYGDIVVVNNKNHPEKYLFKHPGSLTLSFFKSSSINHQASFIRRNLFKEFGLYPEKYKLASDYWLWLISLMNNKKFKHLKLPIVFYDYSGLSTSDGFKLYKQEMDLIWESLVPKIVQGLIIQNEKYKQLLEYKIVKAAVNLNKKYQEFKNRI